MAHAHPVDWSRRLLIAAPILALVAWVVVRLLLAGATLLAPPEGWAAAGAVDRALLVPGWAWRILADPLPFEAMSTAIITTMAVGGAPLVVGWWWRQLARLRALRRPRRDAAPARVQRHRDEEQRLRWGLMGSYQGHLALFVLTMITFNCAQRLGPPGGGGGEVGEQQEEQEQVVQVVRKKMIVNPFSAIKVRKPQEVDIDIREQTQRRATSQVAGGEGEGTGGGYEGGAGQELNFVIVDHGAKGWDEAEKVGAPNLLRELRNRIRVKTANRPVSVDLGDLMAQKDDLQQPPLLYFCLSGAAPKVSDRETAWLARYVLELHGLILLDETGGGRRHAEELARRILPGRPLVPVPADDPLWRMRQPMRDADRALARHGGDRVLGVRDGQRWVLIYHPGDLVDGWRGAYGPQWQEIAYQFGTNIFDYAAKQFTRRLRTAKPQ